MKLSGKKYGFNVLGIESMSMQRGFWKPTILNSKNFDKYHQLPWYLNYNGGINLWNSFEIIDLQIYRRQEYLDYVDYMKNLAQKNVITV